MNTSFGPEIRRAVVDFSGEEQDEVLIYPEKSRAKRIALLGMGNNEDIDAERLRRTAAKGAALAKKAKTETVAVINPGTSLDAETTSQAIVEGFMLASYSFDRYKTQNEQTDRNTTTRYPCE